MNRIALKTITREKKSPTVETIKSTFDKQVQQVATISNVNTLHNSRKLDNGVTLWINPEYDETSDEFNPDKTLQDWLNIKGITLEEFSNWNPDNERITSSPNISGITRIKLTKVDTNLSDICIITLGDFTKHKQMLILLSSQTRLYFSKHEGFLPEGIQQREKDAPATSYYSKLSCAPDKIDKLKQYIKMNIRTDKVKWL
jgi:hypothetical protein